LGEEGSGQKKRKEKKLAQGGKKWIVHAIGLMEA
jgi:hypothetical protein